MTGCPFCDDVAGGDPCGACGRAPTASRRLCPSCKKMSPLDEPECSHCGKLFRNELRWKVPVIIIMFVAAIAASVIVRILLD